ncbi:tyrosine-type recombinase/integrase [uncultured Methanofollis sp.]|uniref:tyrosine-type recombinase/integrase n=1 Tax=uncultured Methanofollis sp. TaxID=262500 RepID=UPI002619E55F|nr:tyrosine-type recombinase/integrase [uncultured Methanofollis sp.]
MEPATNRKRAFHQPDEKYVEYAENTLSHALEEERITPDDAALIREFTGEIVATSHISAGRKYKITYTLVGWRRFIGPFRENGITDLFTGVEKVQAARNEDGEPEFKKNTLADYIRFIKRFYLWMIENGYSTVPEKKVRKIKGMSYDTATKSAEMLLGPEEVRKMIEACTSSRDRALVAMLYEGAFRAGELGNLLWGQVKFTDWNVVINTDFKTGKGRYIPLVMARQYLAQWRNDYPRTVTPEAHVFLNNLKQPLQYQGMAKQLKIIARRAGVEKKVTPHIFRHSRITHMIQEGYQESVIKKIAWGNLGTEMFQTYAHLVDADIDDEIAAQNGIKPPEAKEKAECLEPRQCPRCYTVNAPTHEHCCKCGYALTSQAVDNVRIAEEQVELTPEYQAVYAKVMQDLQAAGVVQHPAK